MSVERGFRNNIANIGDAYDTTGNIDTGVPLETSA